MDDAASGTPDRIAELAVVRAGEKRLSLRNLPDLVEAVDVDAHIVGRSVELDAGPSHRHFVNAAGDDDFGDVRLERFAGEVAHCLDPFDLLLVLVAQDGAKFGADLIFFQPGQLARFCQRSFDDDGRNGCFAILIGVVLVQTQNVGIAFRIPLGGNAEFVRLPESHVKPVVLRDFEIVFDQLGESVE